MHNLHPDQRREAPATVFWDMRWRFDFAGRPSIYGKWSSPSVTAHDKNKEGLVRAAVEGKDRVTGEIKALAECDGHDFVNFQWLATANVPRPMGKWEGDVKPVHRLMGMKLVTRNFQFFVMPDGDVVLQQRTEAEKKMNFATFGR